MTGRIYVSTVKNICFWVVVSLMCMTAFNARANTVTYLLDTTLTGGSKITGTFVWTYAPEDFEGGTGEFISIEIPAPLEYWETLDPPIYLISEIQPTEIEFTITGNYHDIGLDIGIFFDDLSLTDISYIDTDTSKFGCCGNDFQDKDFTGGSITPLSAVPIPAALPLFLSALAGLGLFGWRRKRLTSV